MCHPNTVHALIIPWIRPGSIPQASWYKIQYFGHYIDVYRDDHGPWKAMKGSISYVYPSSDTRITACYTIEN